MKDINIELLAGQIIAEIKFKSDEIFFTMQDGRKFKMFHEQDCSENVIIKKIEGDITNIINYPLIKIKQETLEKNPKWYLPKSFQDSFTWTIFEFETKEGSVSIYWLGESNGYYSERVSFCEF